MLRRLRRALLVLAAIAPSACERTRPPPDAAAVDRDPRPYTPWHRREDPSPFPTTEWFWQDLFARAPDPEPLPTDAAAAERIAATCERVATLGPLESEEELPDLVADARKDPGRLLQALDDPRGEVRFAVARVMLRLMIAPERCVPQRLVEAAALHLRDPADEVALLHLETIARSGFPWTWPILLKTFGKVDNHRLTVLRIRAAAKLAQAGFFGGIPLLIKALKEQTSIQDDVNREWDASPQTAWWKEEAIDGIAAAADGERFGHSPDASDADQVACVRRIESWWSENQVRVWSRAPALTDPALIERIQRMILGLGTFQIRNVDNAGFMLAGLGPRVAPLLFEALRGSSFMVRRHVLGVLSQLVTIVPVAERGRFMTEVTPALGDPDSALRVRALETIGNSRLPEAFPILQRALSSGDAALAETSLRVLSTWATPEARTVLNNYVRSLPPEHALRIPAEAARLAAGDLQGLTEYLQLLGPDRAPDARAQLYLSWIVDTDGLAEAKSADERRLALQRIEASIRARAAR